MNRRCAAAWAVLLTALRPGGLPAGEKPIRPHQVKHALARALPLLETAAAGHVAQSTCFSCHHQALPVLALSLARERGLPVNEDVFLRQLRFTHAALADWAKRNPERKSFLGGQADTAGYALLTLGLGGWPADDTTRAVAEYLLWRHRDLDHWRNVSDRPPSEATPFTTTALALHGLTTYGTAELGERAAKRIAAAQTWLLRTKPRDNEDRVFRLLGLKYARAKPEDVQKAARDLLKSQADDGGWAQTGALKSDAYATGSALTALHLAGGVATAHPAYQRGLRFLLRNQLPDGSWFVKSRSKPFQTYFETGFPHGKDQWISAAASGWAAAALAVSLPHAPSEAHAVLRPQTLLDRERFWENRDWRWYETNIPFFECPDPDIQTTYYYRWELLTRHLTYGSPHSGYSFTEFIDRPFWSGAYGAISCPAGHQLYEARWLRDPRFARDYVRYWFRTPGAQPRNYSTWLADAAWAVHRVHPDDALLKDLLPDLKNNYEAWEKRHFVPEVGLFWQTGHDDGMEFNINSRQTTDIVRGAPGYRPTLNAYMWADALAIARVADRAGDKATASAYRQKAAGLKENLQKKLWDPKRQFFFHMFQRDEEANGFKVKALSLTHQTGRYAGSPFGRELIGYVPWQFSLPDRGQGYETAWKKLLDSNGFAARFGPTTVERQDPMFVLKKTCCWWSGQSWPYATSQTLKALANVLQGYEQTVVTPADYLKLLQTFAKTHRKNGRPYLAEACHPDIGSFAGHDSYNHSEHYFHSSFNDLVITGLVGLRPRDDDIVEVKPLAPADWAYFALDALPYKGRLLSIIWDRDGTRYRRGPGLRLLVDGTEVAAARTLSRLAAKLPNKKPQSPSARTTVNFAVNNDGTYYPRIYTTYSNPNTSATKLIDGNYWYDRDPPNRWTCAGSPSARDAVTIDFGIGRKVHTAKLYFLDDAKTIVPPLRFDLEHWDGKAWRPIPKQSRTPRQPAGRRANVIRFPVLETTKVRAVLYHANPDKCGLTEFEIWGDADRPVAAAPHPRGNLAHNPGGTAFPRASASFADRFGGIPALAIDGKVNFLPNPFNRWTNYESPNQSDWLEVDFGTDKEFARVELAIYDDRVGVQPPTTYNIEFWNGKRWQAVAAAKKTPERPTGNQFNEVRFDRVRASKVRVVFTHAGRARSGVSEILIWKD